MFALIGYSQERLLYVYLQTFLTFNQSKLNSCIVQDIRFFVDRFITYLAYNMRGLKCKSHPVPSYHFRNHKEGNLICKENHLKKSTRKSNMAATTRDFGTRAPRKTPTLQATHMILCRLKSTCLLSNQQTY